VKVYGDLVCVILLGGHPNRSQEQAELLLSVYPRCESQWMRQHTRKALESLVEYHRSEVTPETLEQIHAVLNATNGETDEHS
jgi:hypothetical protein